MDLVLTSALLTRHGFRHGFSLRTGGVSAAPFDSLNLARTVGDDAEAVAENARRFMAAIGAETLFEVSQVHGNTVRVVESGDDVQPVRQVEADALVIGPERGAVAIRTADCVPILVADTASRMVAAVHAGWRGTVAGVVPAAFAALADRGVSMGSIVVAIGPHIRLDAFEVGEDVAREIGAAAPTEEVVRWDEPRPHVDLSRVIRSQLRGLGVPSEAVDDVGGCTYSEPARFFSHRRDQGRSGRHLSAIAG